MDPRDLHHVMALSSGNRVCCATHHTERDMSVPAATNKLTNKLTNTAPTNV